MSRFAIALVLTLLGAGGLAAQTCSERQTKRSDSLPMLNRPTVFISSDSGKVSGSLPFDERFNLSGPADSSLVAVAVRLIRLTPDIPNVEADPCRDSLFNDPRATRWNRTDKRVKVFTVLVRPIVPSSPYVIRVATLTRLPDSVIRSAASAIADSIRTAQDSVEARTVRVVANLVPADTLYSTAERAAFGVDSGVSSRHSTPHKYVVTQALLRVASFQSVRTDRHNDSVTRHADTVTSHGDSARRVDSARRQTDYRTFQQQYQQARRARAGAIEQLDADTGWIRIRLDALTRQITPFSFLLLPNDFDGGHYRSAIIFTQALPARLTREKQRIIDGQTLVENADDTVESLGHAAILHSAAITPIQGRLAMLDADVRDQYELFTIARRDPLVRERLRGDTARLDSAMTIDTSLIRLVSQERETYGALAKSLDALDSAALQYARTVVPRLKPDSLAFFATTDHQFDDRASLYISADIGVLVATPIFQRFSGTVVTPYVGVNIYPLAVNKKAPLSDCEQMPQCRFKRFSATIGVTTSSIGRTGVRTDLFGQHSLYVGVGYRWNSYLRATAGSLMYQTYSTDGAHTLRFNMTPALSLSFDWDVKSTLGGIASLLGGG